MHGWLALTHATALRYRNLRRDAYNLFGLPWSTYKRVHVGGLECPRQGVAVPEVRFDLVGADVAPIYDLGADYHQDGWASCAESLGKYVEIRSAENCISERTELRRPLYSGRRNLCTLPRTPTKTIVWRMDEKDTG